MFGPSPAGSAYVPALCDLTVMVEGAATALVGRLAASGLDRTPPRAVLTMIAGNLVIYAFGLPWLMASVHVGVAKALDLGVTPFLGGDALKIALAAGLLPSAWALVRRSRG